MLYRILYEIISDIYLQKSIDYLMYQIYIIIFEILNVKIYNVPGYAGTQKLSDIHES